PRRRSRAGRRRPRARRAGRRGRRGRGPSPEASAFAQLDEVGAVAGLAELGAEAAEGRGVDPPAAEGDLLGAADLQALALLEGLDEGGGGEQGLGVARVEPGVAAAEALEAQGALREVEA